MAQKINEVASLLYLEQQEAHVPKWGREGLCTLFCRFLGCDSSSQTELRRQNQHYTYYQPGIHEYLHSEISTTTLTLEDKEEYEEAAIRIQLFYRTFRVLQIFKSSVAELLERIRRRKMKIQSIQADENLLRTFRLLLLKGFPGSKLTSQGKWKAVNFVLVLNPKKGDCYLTWKPARGKPRLNLHELIHVDAIKKTDPTLSAVVHKTICHRKSLCLSSGTVGQEKQVILQTTTHEQREVLLHGFRRLIQEIQTTTGSIDEKGVFRHYYKQQTLLFFDEEACAYRQYLSVSATPAVTSSESGNPQDQDGIEAEEEEMKEEEQQVATSALAQKPATEKAKQNLAHFYETRFDLFPTDFESLSPRNERRQKLVEEEQTLAHLFNKYQR